MNCRACFAWVERLDPKAGHDGEGEALKGFILWVMVVHVEEATILVHFRENEAHGIFHQMLYTGRYKRMLHLAMEHVFEKIRKFLSFGNLQTNMFRRWRSNQDLGDCFDRTEDKILALSTECSRNYSNNELGVWHDFCIAKTGIDGDLSVVGYSTRVFSQNRDHCNK